MLPIDFLLATNAAPATSNHIIAENKLPGAPASEWDVNGAGSYDIQGYSTRASLQPGETVSFKIKLASPEPFRVDIYRLGYYGGAGARKIGTAQLVADAERVAAGQPECDAAEPAAQLVDCGNWRTIATFALPANATSGLYFGRPTLLTPNSNWRADDSRHKIDPLHSIAGRDPSLPPDGTLAHAYGASGRNRLRNALALPRASHCWFVVRDAPGAPRRDLLFQTADLTWHAYNGWGGYTTYGSFDYPREHAPGRRLMDVADPDAQLTRAHKRSYNTPLITRDYRAVNMPLSAEYAAAGRNRRTDAPRMAPPVGPTARSASRAGEIPPAAQRAAPARGRATSPQTRAPCPCVACCCPLSPPPRYPAIRFLERNGYSLHYCAGADLAVAPRNAALLRRSRAYLSVGHDEYWTRHQVSIPAPPPCTPNAQCPLADDATCAMVDQRDALEAARDGVERWRGGTGGTGGTGLHLNFWSANEAYWSVRLECSKYDDAGCSDDGGGGGGRSVSSDGSDGDGSGGSSSADGDAPRTMVCYKETQALVKLDPMPDEWTGTFRDARAINPRGARPENALSGTMFAANAQRHDALVVDGARFGRHRAWRGTAAWSEWRLGRCHSSTGLLSPVLLRLAMQARRRRRRPMSSTSPETTPPRCRRIMGQSGRSVDVLRAFGAMRPPQSCVWCCSQAAPTMTPCAGVWFILTTQVPPLVYQSGILGHEWDEDVDNGWRPAGLQTLSETTVDNVQVGTHGPRRLTRAPTPAGLAPRGLIGRTPINPTALPYFRA